LTTANYWLYTKTAMRQAVRVEGISRSFGKTVALAHVDLDVPEGMVYGLLGPNGAGKTTMVRILATLLLPGAGRALVGGHDVVRQADQVRRVIGLTGQYAALDEALTGTENLVLIARLHGMPAAEARRRAAELIAHVGLTEAAGRSVRTYSGGMRRRVDLAASLIGRPRVLFLDEPTTGLDPASRIAMWEMVATTVRDGTTVLLTSQYLEEVDRLASRIAVLDHGRVIAEGTPGELKARVGGQVVAARVPADLIGKTMAALSPMGKVRVETDEVNVPAHGQDGLAEAMRRLSEAGITPDELALRRPTLDEVFLNLTNGGNGNERAA
jgi:oleandomycin transport system ATP-binding protein